MLSVLLRDDKHLPAHPNGSSIPFPIPGSRLPRALNVFNTELFKPILPGRNSIDTPVLEPGESSPGFCSGVWGFSDFIVLFHCSGSIH